MVAGLPGAMRWLVDRHNEKPITYKGCQNMTQTEESKLAAKQGLLYIGLLGNALGWLGVDVGPSPWTAWLSQFPARRVAPRWVVNELTYLGER
jgi:hypothetical protein